MKFEIEAVDPQGSDVNLVAEAESEESAATLARKEGFFPTHVRQIEEARSSKRPVETSSSSDSSKKRAPKQTRECDICGKLAANTLVKCPHCGADLPEDPTSFLISLLLALAVVIGIPLWFIFSALPSAEEKQEYRNRSGSSMDLLEYADGPAWAHSLLNATGENQRLLESYHREGKFTGYTDADEWIRDLRRLRQAEKRANASGY